MSLAQRVKTYGQLENKGASAAYRTWRGRSRTMNSLGTLRIAIAMFIVALWGSCSRSGSAEIDAQMKERLFQVLPENKNPSQWSEPLTGASTSPESFARVIEMSMSELAHRLGGFELQCSLRTKLTRGSIKNTSEEKIVLKMSRSGDAFLEVRDRKERKVKELIYQNGKLYLKNRNGRWRQSRDPAGGRHALFDDSGQCLRSVLDLAKGQYTLSTQGGTLKMALHGEGGPRKSLDLERPSKVPSPEMKLTSEMQPEPGTGKPGYHQKEDAETLSQILGWGDLMQVTKLSGEFDLLQKGTLLGNGELTLSAEVHDGEPHAILDAELEYEVKPGYAEAIASPEESISEVSRKKWPVKVHDDLVKHGFAAPRPQENTEKKQPKD